MTYGSVDICFVAEGDIEQIKAELENRGLEIELGVVPRTGAQGRLIASTCATLTVIWSRSVSINNRWAYR